MAPSTLVKCEGMCLQFAEISRALMRSTTQRYLTSPLHTYREQ